MAHCLALLLCFLAPQGASAQAADCAAPPQEAASTPGRRVEIRVGVSLSRTGTYPDYPSHGIYAQRCFWCNDAEVGIEQWRAAAGRLASSTTEGYQIDTLVEVQDDGGDLAQCLENYKRMLAYTKFFLGPSNYFWNDQVRELLESHGKVMIAWAANPLIYRTPPFEITTYDALDWLNRSYWGADPAQAAPRRLAPAQPLYRPSEEEEDGCGAGNASWAAGPETTRWLEGKQGLRPPAGLAPADMEAWFRSSHAPQGLSELAAQRLRSGARRLQEPTPDVSARVYSLDVNVREEQWAMDALRKVYAEGARRFLFVHFEDVYGAQHSKEVCAGYSEAVQAFGRVWSHTYEMQHLERFLLHLRVVRWADPDVVFLCGTESALHVLIAGTLSLSVSPNAFLADKPMVLVSPAYSYAKSYFLEPSPFPLLRGPARDDVFGSLDCFVKGFREATGRSPGYAALQTSSALSLFLQAFRKAQALEPRQVVDWLKAAAPGSYNHLLGPFSFDELGRRRLNATGTRQIYPLLEGTFSREACEKGTQYTRWERFIFSRVVEVSQKIREECQTWLPGGRFLRPEECARDVKGGISYPIADYDMRQVATYPCVPGCVFNTACHACPAGKFHSWHDRECRDCLTGEYAHVAGMTTCRTCPTGATCEKKDEVPVPQAYYFMMRGSTQAPSFACDSECGPQVEEIYFVRCRPAEVCERGHCRGANVGMGCGQCTKGMTYQGVATGARWCRKCPDSAQMVMLLAFFHLVYGGLTILFFYLGYWASFGPGYMPCALARSFLHYYHLLGVAYEVTNLDAEGYLGYFLFIVDILYRPTDLLMMNCIDPDTDSMSAIKFMSTFNKFMPVVGYGAILMGGLLVWFSSVIKNTIVAVFVTIRNKRRRKVKKPGKAEHSGGSSVSHAHLEGPQRDILTHTMGKLGGHAAEVAKRTAHHTNHLIQETKDVTRDSLSVLQEGESSRGEGKSTRRRKSSDGEAGEVSREDSGSSFSSEHSEEELKFSLIHGPGLNYNEHLESLAIEVQLKGSLIRACLAWALLIFPVALRGVSRLLACDRFDVKREESRMVLNYDVVCHTALHKKLIQTASFSNSVDTYYLSWVICVAAPSALLLYLLMFGGVRLRTIVQRRRSAILFDGYRKGMAWWEALLWLRTGSMIIVAHDAQPAVRLLLMMLMLVIFFALHFFLHPYEPRFREALHSFELLALLGVLSVVVAGQTIALQEQGEQSPLTHIISRHTAGVVVFVLNCLVTIYGLCILFVTRVSTRIQAIIEDGSSVSIYGLSIHRLVQVFPGVSPVFFIKEGDSQYIDVSRLNSFEKTNLARVVNDTMSVCIDSSAQFKTWVVERALNEAFRRAMSARRAALRQLYECHGTKPFKLFRLFKVSLRAPDIPLQAGGEEHLGVTVDELNDALMDVNFDVIERHPCIYGKAPNRGQGEALRPQEERPRVKSWSSQILSIESMIKEINDGEGGDVVVQLRRGDSLLSLGSGPSDLASPSRVRSRVEAETPGEDEGGNMVYDALQEETQEYQRAYRLQAALHKKLEDELRQLDEECEELRQQLQSSAGATQTPSTAPEDAQAAENGTSQGSSSARETAPKSQ